MCVLGGRNHLVRGRQSAIVHSSAEMSEKMSEGEDVPRRFTRNNRGARMALLIGEAQDVACGGRLPFASAYPLPCSSESATVCLPLACVVYPGEVCKAHLGSSVPPVRLSFARVSSGYIHILSD